jgi:hypothetical protein
MCILYTLPLPDHPRAAESSSRSNDRNESSLIIYTVEGMTSYMLKRSASTKRLLSNPPDHRRDAQSSNFEQLQNALLLIAVTGGGTTIHRGDIKPHNESSPISSGPSLSCKYFRLQQIQECPTLDRSHGGGGGMKMLSTPVMASSSLLVVASVVRSRA